MIDAMQGGPATDAEEVPIWERREQEKKRQEETNDLPFGLYLLFSSFTAIAAVRSSFPGDSRTCEHRSNFCMTTLTQATDAHVLHRHPLRHHWIANHPKSLSGSLYADWICFRVCEQEPHLRSYPARQPFVYADIRTIRHYRSAYGRLAVHQGSDSSE